MEDINDSNCRWGTEKNLMKILLIPMEDVIRRGEFPEFKEFYCQTRGIDMEDQLKLLPDQ